LVAAALVVLVVRQGLLGPTLFLALYLLQVVVLVVRIHPLSEYQVALEEAQATAEAVFKAQLVRVFSIKVTPVDYLGLAQTIRVVVVGALEQLV
jgi:hypothetical protein